MCQDCTAHGASEGAAPSPGHTLVFTALCPQTRAREMSFYMDFSFALMASPKVPSGCKSPPRSLSQRAVPRSPKAVPATAASAVGSRPAIGSSLGPGASSGVWGHCLTPLSGLTGCEPPELGLEKPSFIIHHSPRHRFGSNVCWWELEEGYRTAYRSQSVCAEAGEQYSAPDRTGAGVHLPAAHP